MISRKLIAGTAIAAAAALVSASAAMADPIDLSGWLGPVKIKYSNYETVSATQTVSTTYNNINYSMTAPGNGSENYGIFQITSVHEVGGTTTDNILGTGYNYIGLFSGITTGTVNTFAGPTGVGWTSDTSGGNFALYQVPTSVNLQDVINQGLAGYGGACGGNTSCYLGITDQGYTNVLNWTSNPATPTYTLYNPTTGITVNTGSSSSTGDVTGGTDKWQFAPNVFLTNNFCFNNGTGTAQCGGAVVNANNPQYNWPLLSEDPVTATAVPEPATLLLFGAGLLGLGLLRRRRQAA